MIEKEVKFINVDFDAIQKKLLTLGAIDKGKEDIDDIIYYDTTGKWKETRAFIRVRKSAKGTILTYKDRATDNPIDSNEIETNVEDYEKIKLILSKLDLKIKRFQQKRRHKFVLDDFVFDFDEWPPSHKFLEIEGKDETAMANISKELGLDWEKRIADTALHTLEKYFNEPVSTYQYYTFKEIK